MQLIAWICLKEAFDWTHLCLIVLQVTQLQLVIHISTCVTCTYEQVILYVANDDSLFQSSLNHSYLYFYAV